MRVPAMLLKPSCDVVSNEDPTTLDLLIRITPPEPEKATKRPRLNLGLVIDRSGSMSGQKIQYARQAAIYAVEQLRPTDRISVTIYDDRIETIAPTNLAEDKAGLIARIEQIQARGTTALHGGWVEGGIQVSRHLDEESLNRIILLSDGLANVGETNLDVIASDARGLARRGVSTTTLGIGADYNEDLLEAMARSGDGNYYYIQSPKQLPRIFDLELYGLMATLGTDVRLAIRPQAGVTLVELFNDLDKDEAERLRLSNLMFEQPLEVAVRLKIPAMAVETRLVEVELSWYDPQAQTRHNCQADLTLPAVATAQLSDFPTNDEVRQAVALLMSARARQDAVKLVDRGDIEGARHLLRQVKNEMLAHNLPLATTDALGLAALEQDLAEQRLSHYRKMSHYQAYSRGHTAGLGYDDPHRYGGGPQLGDITQESVEAIVNSVGVDFASQGPLSQAIFKAAGPELAHEVARIGRLGLGEACLTPGYNLPARWIIHTAPAGWQGGQGSEAAILAQCYASCISLAEQYGLATIAFPALGAGLLGFPPELAAEIALKTTSRLLRQSRVIGQVKFVCFDPETLRVYQEVFRNYFGMD